MKDINKFIVPATEVGAKPKEPASVKPAENSAPPVAAAPPPSGKHHLTWAELVDGLRVMVGGDPRKVERSDWTERMRAVQAWKSTPEQRKFRRDLLREHEGRKATFAWRRWRWPSIILVNLLFVVSFHFVVQLVEGALTAGESVIVGLKRPAAESGSGGTRRMF